MAKDFPQRVGIANAYMLGWRPEDDMPLKIFYGRPKDETGRKVEPVEIPVEPVGEAPKPAPKPKKAK
jgi:hypothetical protein